MSTYFKRYNSEEIYREGDKVRLLENTTVKVSDELSVFLLKTDIGTVVSGELTPSNYYSNLDTYKVRFWVDRFQVEVVLNHTQMEKNKEQMGKTIVKGGLDE